MPEVRSESAELVLLSLLGERPLYGYIITKEVAARSDGGLSLASSVLYPLLKSLEAQGLILSTWETVKSDRVPRGAGEGEGRRRKWYRLSAKGRKRLEQRVAAHRAYRAIIDAFIGDAGTEGAR